MLLFNGKRRRVARLARADRQEAGARRSYGIRPASQERGPDLHYLFAPLKRARLDYMAQKATEMGASVLRPVLTRRTVAERVKIDRLHRQCDRGGRAVRHPARAARSRRRNHSTRCLRDWDGGRALIFADEAAPSASPLEALAALTATPLAVLIGPEGGFDPRGAREPPCKALRSPHLAWAASDAGRYRRGRRSRPCECRTRRLALKRNRL